MSDIPDAPDPLGGDITNPQSLNRYAYVLNNPTTLTDPLGLNACTNTPGRQAPQCVSANFGPPPGPSWYGGPAALLGIPVFTDTFTPGQPIYTPIESINNEYGEAVSATIYAPGGWTTTYLGDAFTLLGGSAG